MLSASLEGSSSCPTGPNPVSFQITAPALILGVCEIWHTHFKGRLSVSYNPPALLYLNPTGLQSSMGFCSCCGTPQAEKPQVGLRQPLFLRKTSIINIIPFLGHIPRRIRLNCSVTLPSLLIRILFWFLFCIFSYGSFFFFFCYSSG